MEPTSRVWALLCKKLCANKLDGHLFSRAPPPLSHLSSLIIKALTGRKGQEQTLTFLPLPGLDGPLAWQGTLKQHLLTIPLWKIQSQLYKFNLDASSLIGCQNLHNIYVFLIWALILKRRLASTEPSRLYRMWRPVSCVVLYGSGLWYIYRSLSAQSLMAF